MAMSLTPVLADPATRRAEIRQKAVTALTNAFPLQLRDKKIEVTDVSVHSRDYGPNDQKQALLSGGSLYEPVKGTVVMRDSTGKEIERLKNFTLMNLPYFTGRHTFIIDGNEYNVANQLRLKPGVYTRKRANEDLEAAFNLAKGANFRVSLDSTKGHPYVEYGTTAIPLYPILRKLGVPHADIANHWGKEVAEQNDSAFSGKHDVHVSKLYDKLVHPSKQTAKDADSQASAIRDAYANTAMDPEVTKETLGQEFDKVTPLSLLAASSKVLKIYKNNEDTDDRDALQYKTFHAVDDFIKERIGLDARALAAKVKGRATHKTTLKTILPAAPFSAGVKSFITGTSLSSIPSHINPMEAIDHAVRVTSLGEGGIASERAIPAEARSIHSSHLGVLDPIRTSESFRAGIDIRTAMLAHKDAKGNLYTSVRNVKTGKQEFLSTKQLMQAVVAFPKQKLIGTVSAMNKGKVDHVPASMVEYELHDPAQLYSPATNLTPFLESMQGNRGIMSGKFQTQALPLVDREPPLVQVYARQFMPNGKIKDSSWEKELAKLALPTSPVSGKVVKIDSQYIYVDPTGKKTAEEYTGVTKTAAASKRQTTLNGVTLKIELEPGDVRSGKGPDGKTWEKKMSVCYGHIPRTIGDDGETVDVYLNEDGPLDNVYVVHQKKENGQHDEDKCMLGFSSEDEAVEAYKKHGPSWGLGKVTELSWDEFKDDYLTEHAKEAADKDLIRIPYETNLPFASKTYLNHTLTVKPGDTVEEDEPLAESNFTKDKSFALGKNLTIGYVPYYGMNSNDAVVISEGAATKLTSEHMYKEVLDYDRDTTLGRELHKQYFGAKYTAAQYQKLDPNGVVKKGTKVLPKDPLIVGVAKGKLSASDMLIGNLKKTLVSPYREVIRDWHHDFEGEVTDVHAEGNRVVVTVKTREPMRVGDKLTGRHGNKGVVSLIVPDHKMLQDESGKPLDVLYTSAGVISRINPSQILETAVAKVAKKMGKPIAVENFSGRDNVQWAKDLLKKHEVKDKETLTDPVSGKKIPNVFVGPQYVLRLFKTTETNFAARGTGAYDVNQQPIKGGDEGAKAVGKMEFNALVAHNARNVLRETAVIKSQKNDEFWRSVQLGLPLPPLKTPFAYDKFVGMLHGAGVKVDTRGSVSTLSPLTDADVAKMSAGSVVNEKLVRAKDLAPERGGLFDPAVTGGTTGTKWSHVDLAEPVVNPVFAEPARRILGLTSAEFEKLVYEKGASALKDKLNQINVPSKIVELRNEIKRLSGTKLDDAVKRLKYLEALNKQNLKAGDAYVMSKLPVLPPVMRPILPGKNGSELVVGDSNYLYQSAMLHNKALQQQVVSPILPPNEHAQLRKNLANAVGAVIGTNESDNPKLQKRQVKGFIEHLTGKTTPKSSFFHKKIMKRQQDVSGRGTIAPDGSLGMDEVGLPEDMLWGMYSKFVIARLVRRGFGAVQAKEMVDKKHPAARDALMAEVAERPVMVNRAPTLHRYGFVGAKPVPVAGKTIRVNPFIELGMNADYDGDTFQIHVPVTQGAVNDVKHMTLSNLLFSERQKDALMVSPRMEAALGIHLATKAEPVAGSKVHKFKTKEDAIAAYKRGEITLNTPVEIGP